jgi:hypothetical protein
MNFGTVEKGDKRGILMIKKRVQIKNLSIFKQEQQYPDESIEVNDCLGSPTKSGISLFYQDSKSPLRPRNLVTHTNYEVTPDHS